MDERNVAIWNKAACYGVAAATVVVIGCLLVLYAVKGFPTNTPFWAGVAVGAAVIPIAELLIIVPPKETRNDRT